MNIKVSVIVPVYNTEKYIGECLASIICQTLEDIEIICIDDVSTDSSATIIKEYMNQDNRIKFYQNQKNAGLSFCRNFGISKANGKYIQFLDSDDFLEIDALEKMWCVAEESELEVVIINHKVKYEVSNKTDETNFDKRLCGSVMDGKSMFVRESEYNSFVVTAWSQFVRCDFLTKNDIKFYEGIYHEDHLYSYYIRVNAKRIMAINEQVYTYRIRKNSITTGIVEIKHIKGLLRTILEIKNVKTEGDNSKFNMATNSYIEILKDVLYQKLMINRNTSMYLNLDGEEQQLLWNIIDKKIYYPFRKAYFAIKEKKPKKIIIYGAGRVARTVIYLLEEKGIRIDRVAVSELDVNKKKLYGYEICQISDIVNIKKDALVLIAVQNKNSDMLTQLNQLGFEHIVSLW